MSKKRALVAMSGGVDSSVTAHLLREAGYEVSGVTLRLVSEINLPGAAEVAARMSVPHRYLDLQKDFDQFVINDFLSEYQRGRTPNPCARCNQHIKFGKLLDYALSEGYDYLVTGHYVRVRRTNHGHRLLKAKDRRKDQSYFLYTLGQRQLAHLLFPLGQYYKSEVKEIARSLDIYTTPHKESQDICFLSGTDYRDFVGVRIQPASGDIVDADGTVTGQHRGLAFYTVGQRSGIGSGDSRRYVIRLDEENNRVVTGSRTGLTTNRLVANNIHWVSGEPPQTAAVTARFRYRATAASVMLEIEGGNVGVTFKRPQQAVAPGQAVVFYQRDNVLGGGIIRDAYYEKR
jgi:tRNA-uridine 2-sulfurtransferase